MYGGVSNTRLVRNSSEILCKCTMLSLAISFDNLSGLFADELRYTYSRHLRSIPAHVLAASPLCSQWTCDAPVLNTLPGLKRRLLLYHLSSIPVLKYISPAEYFFLPITQSSERHRVHPAFCCPQSPAP